MNTDVLWIHTISQEIYGKISNTCKFKKSGSPVFTYQLGRGVCIKMIMLARLCWKPVYSYFADCSVNWYNTPGKLSGNIYESHKNMLIFWLSRPSDSEEIIQNKEKVAQANRWLQHYLPCCQVKSNLNAQQQGNDSAYGDTLPWWTVAVAIINSIRKLPITGSEKRRLLEL